MLLKCTIVIEDEVNCRIGGLRPEHLELLWAKFGIYKTGYRFMPLFQLHRWDGRIRFFEKTGKTYTRLLEEILPYLITWGYDIGLEDKRPEIKPLVGRITADMFKIEGYKLRDYQVESANAMLDLGSGFGVLATGAGKTSLTAAMTLLLRQNGHQVLIIVPSQNLVDQTAKDIIEKLQHFPEHTVGTYSGEQKDIDHPIVVATWQSLQNVPHYMQYFTAVVVDEAHGAKAEVIKNLLSTHGKHISYRWGLTGTMPKDEDDAYTLKTVIGTVACTITARWLMDNGYLSTIDIKTIETQDLDDEFPDYSSEKAFLSKNPERLELIAKLIQADLATYGNTMVLVNSVSQGRALEELIPGSVFMSGETDTSYRQEKYDEYANQDGIILIATVGIASTGISIDRIFHLVLLDVGKSFIKCIQSIGRGLRKKGDKNHVHVTDISSSLKFSKKHAKDRRTYYKEAEYPFTKTPQRIKYESQSKMNGLVL